MSHQETQQRVAIFGGSFNPPHLGHQSLCLMVLEACDVDQLWVIPTYEHHLGKELTAYNHRFAMCERMVAPLGTRALVSDIEKRTFKGQSSRTLETLEALANEHANASFRLVIGADILSETHRWYRWDDVIKLAPPLVFSRHGFEGGELPAPPDISSTQIRASISAGKPHTHCMPRSVLSYIHQEGLYR
jgi:nicotinate-nucleotide adenylyltransferase